MKKKWTLEACKKDALQYETRNSWVKNSAAGYGAAQKNGWIDECCEHMVELHKPYNYWTLETCKEDALKYTSKSEWSKNSGSAYVVATKNKWLDECCGHMEILWAKKWTLETCREDALKYNTKSEWKNSKSGGYSSAVSYKWINECCKHMIKPKRTNKWTLETCREDALKYNTKVEWKKNSGAGYGAAQKNGWIDECCEHMIKPKKISKWTLEICKEDALRYDAKIKWRNSKSGSYSAAKGNGWIDECCSHMELTKKPDGFWTLETCKEDALKYNTKVDWKNSKSGGYNAAQRIGCIDECGVHMEILWAKKWTLETCREDALKYNTRSDWQNSDGAAYQVATKNNWLNECCAHMKVLTWHKHILIAYLEQIKDYLHVCTIPQLMTIIESNGLFNYITQEKLKKLQETKPDSEERKIVTEQITKELTCKDGEELEVVSDANVELEETSVIEILNPDNTNADIVAKSEDEESKDNTELREKQLKELDNKAVTASLDDERVQFLVTDFVNSLWYDVLNGKLNIKKIEALSLVNDVPSKIKEDFIKEYNEVINIKLPDGWSYQHKPLLMQKLITYRLQQHKRYGNWSGVGAGKTIGAILAGRYIGAKNTLIITFNSTIGKEDERGWIAEINWAFKDSKVFSKIDKHITFDNRFHNYLVLNYETFQQKGSANYVIELLEKNKFDYIILDEVQSVKQSNPKDESKRREVIFGLVGKVRELNPDYYLLAMSATPVINNLVEAKSLVELIEFTELEDVETRPTTTNCIELFRRLTNCGIRHKNVGDNILKRNKYTTIEVEANHLYEDAKEIASDDFLGQDRLVLDAKLEAIKPYLNASKGKTVIYTYYVDGIDDYVYDYLTNLGYKVGVYTGSKSKRSREEALNDFIKEKYDILLGSKPISTGVDGLQKVADRLIILSLPWTNAELVQLVGRINRKGSNFKEVDVIIPLVTISDGKKLYRWDNNRYNGITFKKTIANAAVDGIIPDKLIVSKEKFVRDAKENFPEWIERLKRGDVLTVDRKELEVRLFPEITNEEERKRKINSELSEFNRMGKTTLSGTMHKKFSDDPESWHRYHGLRRESMKDWDEIPYEVIAKEITCESDKVIDFGCGDNQFKNCIKNQVTSVDHIAVDDTVIACDMKDLSQYVENESHDVAVFSLSLWGTNYPDYLAEAYRVLKRKGMIYIAEPSKDYESVEKQNQLITLMSEAGFKVVGKIDVREKFTYITGIKI